MAILNIYKQMGDTPLQAMEALKVAHPEYSAHVMVYAGRLDPMAEGLLVVLTNEDRHNLNEYLGKSKTYEATILFGFESDTYDILGIPHKCDVIAGRNIAKSAVSGLVGEYELPFPAYSAHRVKGKPLHWWARAGRLDEVEIPKKIMCVEGVRDVAAVTRDADDTLNEIVRRVELVDGGFRQEKIVKAWKSILSDIGQPLVMVKVTLDVASGTYIRSLAHMLGSELGSGALLFNLKRTRVGGYELM